jgi:hypothetical protein
MPTIRIPKTPASAYNDQRRASDLLRAHVQNLEKAVRGSRSRSVITDNMTEAEAARYIRELARQLHQKTLLPQLTQAPTIGQRPVKARGKSAKPSRSIRGLARKPASKAGRTVRKGRR